MREFYRNQLNLFGRPTFLHGKFYLKHFMSLLRGKTRCPAEVVPESPGKFGVFGAFGPKSPFFGQKRAKKQFISPCGCVVAMQTDPSFNAEAYGLAPLSLFEAQTYQFSPLKIPDKVFRPRIQPKKKFFGQNFFDPGKNDQFWSKKFFVIFILKMTAKTR